MRVAQPVLLSKEVRRKLEQQSRGRSTQARVVLRSRIVLLAAEGMQNKQIARGLSMPFQIVCRWRKRFFEERLAGLDELPRRGRPRVFSPSNRHGS